MMYYSHFGCASCSSRQCILDAEARDSAISLICASLLEEGVCGTVKEVARETIKLVKQEKREKLEGLKSLFLTRQVGKSWKRYVFIPTYMGMLHMLIGQFGHVTSCDIM